MRGGGKLIRGTALSLRALGRTLYLKEQIASNDFCVVARNLVKQCPTCTRDFPPRKEPMILTQLPDYPWQNIGTDLFHLKGVTYIYILMVDYFSRYPEIQRLTNTTSRSIIQALTMSFTIHGIPETVVSNNGPQYASQEFANFAKKYDFTHITSRVVEFQVGVLAVPVSVWVDGVSFRCCRFLLTCPMGVSTI